MKRNLWKIILSVVIIVVVASFYYRNEYLPAHNKNTPLMTVEQKESAQDKILIPGSTGRLMMIDLGSTGCVPCQMMEPIIDELTLEYKGKVDIQFIDVNEHRNLAEIYRIYAIPTQIFFDAKGKEVFRHEGFYPKAEIVKKLKEIGLK